MGEKFVIFLGTWLPRLHVKGSIAAANGPSQLRHNITVLMVIVIPLQSKQLSQSQPMESQTQ